MSKTDGVCLNIIGHRIDDDPVPILYIGPTRSNVDSVIEPRIQQMLRSSESLWKKLLKGKSQKKLVKKIGGVTIRLAWAGSPTELASQPACIVIVDEIDRMQEDVGEEGDPVTLAEARTATYPNYLIVLDSTPTIGSVETEVDKESGIEFWKKADRDDLTSPIWKYFQEGTCYEWAVPCQSSKCGKYFVPRFQYLTWPKGLSQVQTARRARLLCAQCGFEHDESMKSVMNQGGLFITRGQRIENGKVVGDPPDTDTSSFWISGLMSPWKSFEARCLEWLRAVDSGSQARIQAVINTSFGELYRTKGEAPEWEKVRDQRVEYKEGDVVDFVRRIYLTVDVQKNRLVYVIRGWGAGYRSALIEKGELFGDTDKPEVWALLDKQLERQLGGKSLNSVAVDSGYRSGPVYEFCKRHRTLCYATKGIENPRKLYAATEVEVDKNGKKIPFDLKLWSFDSGYFKGWVHDHIGWTKGQPGEWLLPSDISEDYCRQIVAEQKTQLPSGKIKWIRAARDNHYLDCEAMQALLAHMGDVRHLIEGEGDRKKKSLADLAKAMNE